MTTKETLYTFETNETTFCQGGNAMTVKEELEILSKVLTNIVKSYEDIANRNYGCTYIQDIYKLQATTYHFVNKLVQETLNRINVK